MALSENFDEFLDLDDFAVSGSYTPDGGSSKEIRGIFDKEYLASELGEVVMSSAAPMFLTKSSNVENEAGEGSIIINSVTYNIVEPKPDGTGMTLLILADLN